ncbi:hypothetical protein SERLA73DRAFT_192490 [Serpula lacrymans var. lacrymans S7.3]|uniref:Uncharacterized protein n=1 Tax=Serpula lacrymans var. lacrymans (strain S7.3) TaxID=936435 RepID=F8QKR6_SERL3|nr:hypothetical protein SERLA73DRAFT_192490 [Serpula lacrymans var. lacrymans S7.3]
MMSWEDAVKRGKAKHYQYQHSSFIPPVHHLVQIRQFHGLTNGLVVLDHLIKRGRERSSSNLEQVSSQAACGSCSCSKDNGQKISVPKWMGQR